MNTKNVLMLVILSAGMLTGLTATMIQVAPVYADTKDCEKITTKTVTRMNKQPERYHRKIIVRYRTAIPPTTVTTASVAVLALTAIPLLAATAYQVQILGIIHSDSRVHSM